MSDQDTGLAVQLTRERQFWRQSQVVNWITIPTGKTTFLVSEVDEIKRAADSISAAVDSHLDLFQGFRNEANVCYVTLATPSYEWGLRVMLRSLRKVSRVPVIILSSQRWTFNCQEPDVLFLEVPSLVNSQYVPRRDEHRETLNKLWVFCLASFRRITYVDADCLFLRSIDDLFDTTGFVAGADYVFTTNETGFNAGLMSFEPTQTLRDHIFEQAHCTPSLDGGDQGLLNELLGAKVRVLPPEYDLLRHYHYFAGAELKRDETRMVHFIVKKPWELGRREPLDQFLIDLDELWTRQLTHDELLSLVSAWRHNQFFPRTDLEIQLQAERTRRARRARRRRHNLFLIMGGVIAVATIFFMFGYLSGGALRG